jgi:fatty-acyl-CoA synthase
MNAQDAAVVVARAEDDSSAASAWLRALELTAAIAKRPERTLPVAIEELAASAGDAPALICDRETLSFRALAQRARSYAHWARAQGLAKGDVVCLLMPNRPDYMAIWLGITQTGAVVSLLNTQLAGPSLAHCIDIVAPKHLIVADTLLPAFASARPHLASAPAVWTHGGENGGGEFPDIEAALSSAGNDSAPPVVATTDLALIIYTSGTTGFPKAARVSHYRLMAWSAWFAGMMGVARDDRMYNCLPMYHSIGGVVATGAVLLNGGSVVIREKFSAREFWDDVTRFDCTLFQYIGELCRYLVQAPAHPRERAHRLRICCGNGLRPDVWTAFKERFAIPRILEFYAATEGNVTMFNAEGMPGAIGRIPAFLAHRSPTALVRFDVEAGAPLRDAQGFCVRCGIDEAGEAIGKIPDGRSNAGARFEGYTSREDTDKKVLRNVFASGDAWFRTGDLMRRDAKGYFYFVDRIGDTFRWKGENVSTAEVAETLTQFSGINEATVYGVAVPGHDGRAGMAALVCESVPDLVALREHLRARLPAYARPLFLRLRDAIEITSTFKHRKSDLVRDGFDPAATVDPIYVHDAARGAFVRLDAALLRRIQDGKLRL